MSKIIFPERESRLLEFKSKVTDFSALIKTSIAFANAAGERIVIGVDDKTREIVGITENERLHTCRYFKPSPNLLPICKYKSYRRFRIILVITLGFFYNGKLIPGWILYAINF